MHVLYAMKLNNVQVSTIKSSCLQLYSLLYSAPARQEVNVAAVLYFLTTHMA